MLAGYQVECSCKPLDGDLREVNKEGHTHIVRTRDQEIGGRGTHEVSKGLLCLAEYTLFGGGYVIGSVLGWCYRPGAIVKETCCARMGRRRITRSSSA